MQLSTHSISSDLSVVRSEVAAIGAPFVKINDQLCLLQGSVESNTQLLVSQNEAHHGKNIDFLRNVQQTQDSVLHQLAQLQSKHEQEAMKRHQEMMKTLQSIQRIYVGSSSHEAVVRGLAGKPALLKEMSDNVHRAGKTQDPLAATPLYVRPSPNMAGLSIRHHPSRPILGRVCTCPRLRSVLKSKWIQLGHASFSSEQQTTAHWPGCSLAKRNSQKRMTMGFRYNGLVRILKTAVSVSFAMTSGAGGFSISPSFACIPTIDDSFDPAFRILELLGNGTREMVMKGPLEHFVIACIERLDRLLNDGKVSATAVNSQNMSLMHYATLTVGVQVRIEMYPKLTRS